MAGAAGGEFADAQELNKTELLARIESITLDFLRAVEKGDDPELHLAARSGNNVVRDSSGCIRLGAGTTTKKLFARKAAGARKIAKIWQTLAFIQKLLLENKVVTQREVYYCLVQHFNSQTDFNNTLQDVIALLHCTRSSLGICASSSGAIAGLVLWKEAGCEPIDCSAGSSCAHQIPGIIDGVTFQSTGARYILVVEKDAVFTYLCGQCIWNTLPCIVITGCGYPPLSVRATVKQLVNQLKLPVLGLFDYNPHGVQILLTYKYGSTRMGMESYSYGVDVKWLGLHYNDVLGPNTSVAASALQSWSPKDQQTFAAVISLADQEQPCFIQELHLMQQHRVKAEIESLNSETLNALETLIIQKILRKSYI